MTRLLFVAYWISNIRQTENEAMLVEEINLKIDVPYFLQTCPQISFKHSSVFIHVINSCNQKV